jgi:hypothetical protein
MFEPFSERAKPWERTARGLRGLVRVTLTELLDPWALAPEVGLRVVDLAGRSDLSSACDGNFDVLHGEGNDCWSGGVFPEPLPDGTFLCLLNPRHSHRRNKITLMEEIVHAHLKHKPTKLIMSDCGLQVRDYNTANEQEAYGVGAAVLLPWQTFFKHLNAGMTAESISSMYDVTEALVQYRIKITGASKLYNARQRVRA